MKQKLAIRMKQGRTKLNMTQSQLAEKLNVSPQFICNIETNRAPVPRALLSGLVAHLKMSKNEVKDLYKEDQMQMVIESIKSI